MYAGGLDVYHTKIIRVDHFYMDLERIFTFICFEAKKRILNQRYREFFAYEILNIGS
jgi:hypothetical protein